MADDFQTCEVVVVSKQEMLILAVTTEFFSSRDEANWLHRNNSAVLDFMLHVFGQRIFR